MHLRNVCLLFLLLFLVGLGAFSARAGAYTFKTAMFPITITGLPNNLEASHEIKLLQPNLEEVSLKLTATNEMVFPVTGLEWSFPSNDMQTVWTTGQIAPIGADWSPTRFKSMATQQAPVMCLIGQNNLNRFSFALSEALETTEISAGVREENAQIEFKVSLFKTDRKKRKQYILRFLLDHRGQPYEQSLAQITQWYQRLPGLEPASVPEMARLPMYSSWYNFHQQIAADTLLKEAELARSLGIRTIIIDDGWQTLNNERGYKFCGDWEPARIPQVRDFVDALHKKDMKVMFWYSVPYIGKNSKAWGRFKSKFLFVNRSDSSVGTLDPRFPEVRAFLIGHYKNALSEWDLDGLKLDFVDKISLLKSDNWVTALNYSEEANEGRDYASVYEALDRLMSDIMKELKAIKPNVMIEFRQSYVGPYMRKYGNMFRVGDCPDSYIRNRIGMAQLKLFSGETAVHADPQMWHNSETAELAAQQLIHTLFAVPQISVKLYRLPARHKAMLKFWLAFMTEHRQTLQTGNFKALDPAMSFPLLESEKNGERIVGLYLANQLIRGKETDKKVFVANGTGSGTIAYYPVAGFKGGKAVINDATGIVVEKLTINKGQSLVGFNVPSGGLLQIEIAE